MPKTTACAGCGKTIMLGPGSRPPGVARCRPCQRIETRIRNGGRSRPPRGNTEVRNLVCPQCGESFSTMHPLKDFCSKRCSREASRNYPSCFVCGTDLGDRHSEVCLKCFATSSGVALPSRTDDLESRRSRDTRREYRRRRREWMREESENIDRVEVFEDDSYVCQLCGAPVLALAKFPHPLSPSIDHIVPLSKGGRHVRANVQTAHFRCNSAKQDRETDLKAG